MPVERANVNTASTDACSDATPKTDGQAIWKRLLLIVTAMYAAVCFIIVWRHSDLLLNMLWPRTYGYDGYNSYSYLYLSVQFVSDAAAVSGLLAVIAGVLLKASISKRSHLAKWSYFAVAVPFLIFAAPGATYVVVNLPGLIRYTWASQAAIQHNVCVAAFCNRPDELQKLMSQGADPDSVLLGAEPDNAGALQLAVRANNVRCVDILLKSGACPKGSGNGFLDGWTALDHAVITNNIQMVRKLIAAGADVNDSSGSAVGIAIAHKYTDILALMFGKGISKQTYEALEESCRYTNDSRGLTLLHTFRPKQ